MKKSNKAFVYTVSNYNRTVFYTGVTSNLEKRLSQHDIGQGSEFAKKYKCKYLVYFEEYDRIIDAITRVKSIKNRHRDNKISLIQKMNPELEDLKRMQCVMSGIFKIKQ